MMWVYNLIYSISFLLFLILFYKYFKILFRKEPINIYFRIIFYRRKFVSTHLLYSPHPKIVLFIKSLNNRIQLSFYRKNCLNLMIPFFQLSATLDKKGNLGASQIQNLIHRNPTTGARKNITITTLPDPGLNDNQQLKFEMETFLNTLYIQFYLYLIFPGIIYSLL